MARTRDCFEPDLDLSVFSSRTVCCTDLASAVANPDWAVICFVTFDRAVFDASLTAERAEWRDLPAGLLAGFDIEILHFDARLMPHHRSPTSALKPAGQDLWRYSGAQSR